LTSFLRKCQTSTDKGSLQTYPLLDVLRASGAIPKAKEHAERDPSAALVHGHLTGTKKPGVDLFSTMKPFT
jgi:hypothetical protein